MQNELLETELVALRNMFLTEMKDYLIALQVGTAEELSTRRERIKILETLLEEKKEAFKNTFPSRKIP